MNRRLLAAALLLPPAQPGPPTRAWRRPVLLFIHGAPGNPLSPFASAL